MDPAFQAMQQAHAAHQHAQHAAHQAHQHAQHAHEAAHRAHQQAHDAAQRAAHQGAHQAALRAHQTDSFGRRARQARYYGGGRPAARRSSGLGCVVTLFLLAPVVAAAVWLAGGHGLETVVQFLSAHAPRK